VPDISDPNYQNLLVQKTSLNDQLINVQNIKQSTIASFNTQDSQLKQQKLNNYKQIEILKTNINNLKQQKKTIQNDIGIQGEDLEKQITQLEKSLSLLKQNKEQSLASIENNIDNIK
jgi:uncharacterized protein involved in exopolysaccharide biosynthesis